MCLKLLWRINTLCSIVVKDMIQGHVEETSTAVDCAKRRCSQISSALIEAEGLKEGKLAQVQQWRGTKESMEHKRLQYEGEADKLWARIENNGMRSEVCTLSVKIKTELYLNCTAYPHKTLLCAIRQNT